MEVSFLLSELLKFNAIQVNNVQYKMNFPTMDDNMQVRVWGG